MRFDDNDVNMLTDTACQSIQKLSRLQVSDLMLTVDTSCDGWQNVTPDVLSGRHSDHTDLTGHHTVNIDLTGHHTVHTGHTGRHSDLRR